MSRKFWNWTNPPNPDANESVRVLHISGPIAEESWFDDETTPALFADELHAGEGAVTVWINSPGGDCIAAAQIYNMLMDYPGHVTVIIDGLAASAASVIAMAASTVKMTPVSMMMIHNPATLAMGDKQELGKAIEMLDAVKESIINAYELKTGMQRAKLARLMDAETWMDARAAIDMGFADELHHPETSEVVERAEALVFNRRTAELALVNKLTSSTQLPTSPEPEPQVPDVPAGRSIAEALSTLDNLKNRIRL
ncbi:head maturation protease, ClpP-related [Trueperella pyogenes]|uniref:head maturation protease, ClpP-related n=1 Tax=Trueperella pyogenes TaxID=1661 RepID=UPI000D52ABA5|nr:head maturation protease, ClpP-related [Trueperella pyogenes]AWG03423.1 peptidase [Trueperella pyogenes]AWG16154.1 peptidase [Trueperella pyogenes]AZR05037.1 Clp protease ClpP [Trueperella pyogenes]